MAEIVDIGRRSGSSRNGLHRRLPGPPQTAQQTFAFASANSDEEIRERALDTGASFVVEAPAGSGKTGLLLQRFLKLLGSPDVSSPEQVLAITFTRAATEEIRARVLKELDAAAREDAAPDAFTATMRSLAAAVLARDRLLGWGLREDPRRLRVRSIDSVCAEIARLLPVMSGGGANVTPIEDPQPLLRQAARRTLLQLGGEDRALSDALDCLLLHRDGDLNGCEELLAEMLAGRDQWGALLPLGAGRLSDKALDDTVRPRLDKALEEALCAGLTRISQSLPAPLLQDLAEAAAEMSTRPGHPGPVSPIVCCSGKHRAPEAIAEHLEQWKALAGLLITGGGAWRKGLNRAQLGFEPMPGDQERLQQLIADFDAHPEALPALRMLSNLPPPRYPEEQWLVTRALFRVLERALVELKFVFAETGECDFAEPALLARAALAHRGGAEAYSEALGSDLRHLLVDEMQDTSTGQYELLELITEDWASEGRTVFLVGDPKQSIYLFRQARVERFIRTLREHRLGTVPLRTLQLSANFRSRRPLVSAFNTDFGHIFPAVAEREDDVTYKSAQAVRDASLTTPSDRVWHLALAHGKPAERARTKREIVLENAEKIRGIITDWRRRPRPDGAGRPWKIAVLVASRRELKPIVAALKRDDGDGPVPFRAINVDPLGDQPEVLDLLALTRALLHPADRVAWLALLRAPWCGLELRDLHRLTGADDPAFTERMTLDLLRDRAHHLSVDGRARARITADVLSAAIAETDRIALPELIERTWRSLGGDLHLSPPARSNAEQFFRLLDATLREDGEITAEAVDRRIKRLFAAPAMTEDAVDLTTIHGAKGLEWDVVLIPELERRAPATRSRLLEWEEIAPHAEGAARAVLAPIKGTHDDSSALGKWLSSLRTERLVAERRRQFYVACTRAREELHLFATADLDQTGTVRPESMSLLQAAWPAVEERLRAITEVRVPRLGSAPTSLRLPRPGAGGSVALSLAASAETSPSPAPSEPRTPTHTSLAMLGRLPLHIMAAERNRAAAGLQATPVMAGRRFVRPEGSFRARSLGNAVHAFLELAASHMRDGRSTADLISTLPQWSDRIRTLLRSDGIEPADVTRLSGEVRLALTRTLESPVGQWLLGPRLDAQSEYALSIAHGAPGSVRLDRIFRAGPSPMTAGDDHLWIVDYKTGVHAATGLKDSLEQEKAKYIGQLTAYADVFPDRQVILALWYPMLAQLVWWPARAPSSPD